MIHFDNISKRYPGGHTALSEVNLRLPKGEMAFLTGHSGAGKSTLLKLIAMIERPSRGQIFLDGVNLNNISNQKIPYIRRNIGIIFQNHHLLYDRPVFDNVAMPLIIQGYRRQEIHKRVRAALNQVGLLSKEKSDPITLSGGEQQRVGIARAIVHKPPLLLADEPTGNLDPELSLEIMQLFARFNQVGTTVLIASHDLDLINHLGSPTISLQDGKISHNGLPFTLQKADMRNSPHKNSQLKSYFAHHLRVSIASLGRLYAQPVSTFMTAAVIAIALALPVGLYIALDNIGQLSSGWDNSTKISLFLHTDVRDKAAQQLMARLEKHKDIKKIEYIDKEKGLNQFKATSGFGDALKYLDDNPLPIVLVVHPKVELGQANKTTALVEELGKNKLVELAQLDVQWVKRLYTFLEIANRGIWVISSMLAFAVLLIVGNTIRLDIQNRRAEIEVSKLIGASNAFIRRPFLYTGIWYGIIGSLLAWIITLISLLLMETPIHNLALLYQSDFRLTGLGISNTLFLILTSSLLGLIGSWIAVSKHLKEIEPS